MGLEKDLYAAQEELTDTKTKQKELAQISFSSHEDSISFLVSIAKVCSEREEALEKRFKQVISKPISQANVDDAMVLLWKMGLSCYHDLFEAQKLGGEFFEFVDDPSYLTSLGMKQRDACCFLYHLEFFKAAGYKDYITNNPPWNCIICEHNTPEDNIHLLQEYCIELNPKIIHENNWLAAYLIKCKNFSEFTISIKEIITIRKLLKPLQEQHEMHIKEIQDYNPEYNRC